MQQQINGREQELRQEWQNQKMTGIPNYSQWLEQMVIAAERDKNLMEMAAEKNYQCWQEAEHKLDQLRYADFDEAQVDYEREETFDCSQFVHQGVIYCSAAGSEPCDWDCPNSRDIGKRVDDLPGAEQDGE